MSGDQPIATREPHRSADAPPVRMVEPPAQRPASQLKTFGDAWAASLGRRFPDYGSLHAYSVEHFREFWAFFLRGCQDALRIEGQSLPVCEGDAIEQARFFPHLRLNYADSLLNADVAAPAAVAITEIHSDRPGVRVTRGELREKVARAADALARLGIGEGDRVVALLRNDADAVAVALAVAAIGATLSTASPDMGVDAVLDRFAPLAPRLLIAHAAPRAFDTGMALDAKVCAIAQGLPALEAVVRLDGALPGCALRQLTFDELVASGEAARFPWPRFPFNQPLFIMFSSGTTGKPKCIVHGAGGTLLEHVKEHRLHTDLRPGDRMYFHTSCSWMMWNWQLSALASGVEIVTYDGPISSVDRLWRLVAEERVQVFGTSPAYLKMGEDAGLEPARRFDLSALRAILSTGAVLYDSQFEWLWRQLGPLPVQSISGGTDIIGCFVLGHPDLPVHAGEAQCKSLGLDVRAWDEEAGAPARAVGSLVCARPFPSRPLGFFGDTDGARFHAAYFSQNPGLWTHGDLVEFPASGGARLHGRCDGVLNVRGIKFAPAEILRVFEHHAQLQAALVVEQRTAGQPQGIVALLVLREGAVLDGELTARLRRDIAARLSPAHVPDRFIDVPELPVTHNGKLSEAAARHAVSGLPVAHLAALRNPDCLEAIRRHPGLQDPAPCVDERLASAPLEIRLQALWQQLLGVSEVGLDDNYFELGGNSLLAAVLLARVRDMTGRALPIAAMLQAPTVRQLARMIEQGQVLPLSQTLVQLRAGVGRPVFLIHGLSGLVMDCWPLVRALRSRRPVFGLQARGIDGDQPPLNRVEAIADLYAEAIQAEQPHGPYAVCGFSFGGVIALEVARRLARTGERLEMVCLLDPHVNRRFAAGVREWHRLVRFCGKLSRMERTARRAYALDTAKRLLVGRSEPVLSGGMLRPDTWSQMQQAQQHVYESLVDAMMSYDPEPYDASPILFVRAGVPLDAMFNPMPVWRRVARAGLAVRKVPGLHSELVGANAQLVGALIDAALNQPPSREPGIDTSMPTPPRTSTMAG